MGEEINETVGELVSSRLVAATICESATAVLMKALDEHGVAMTSTDRARIAREIGNNAAMLISLLQVTRK